MLIKNITIYYLSTLSGKVIDIFDVLLLILTATSHRSYLICTDKETEALRVYMVGTVPLIEQLNK